jgi:hypothetical protein
MGALIPVLVVVSFLLLGVAIFVAELVIARRHLREVRIVRCPEVARAAAVRLAAGRAAVTQALGGAPRFEIAECTRWPRAAACDRACLCQIEANPDETLGERVRRWMERRSCSGCGALFENAPGPIVLVSPLGTKFEWDELPADWLADAMEGWRPYCGECGRSVGTPNESGLRA